MWLSRLTIDDEMVMVSRVASWCRCIWDHQSSTKMVLLSRAAVCLAARQPKEGLTLVLGVEVSGMEFVHAKKSSWLAGCRCCGFVVIHAAAAAAPSRKPS